MSEPVDLSLQWQDHRGYWKVVHGLNSEGVEYLTLNGAIVRSAGPSDNLPWMVDVWVDLDGLKIVGTQPAQDWLEDWSLIPNQDTVHSHLLNQRLTFLYDDWEIVWHRFAGWRGFRASDEAVTVYCETPDDVRELIDARDFDL